MQITEFIVDFVIRPRLRQKGCLVIYDPDKRYKDICMSMQTSNTKVIDASTSSIHAREAGLTALQEISSIQTELDSFLIYVPKRKPLTDEEKQADPFSLYLICGSVFPDNDGDEYQNLCLRAKPDHATELRRIFQDNPNPPFSIIDAVGGGVSWPSLRALLKVDSARDILRSFLIPNPYQKNVLDSDDSWVQEAKEFLLSTLGLRLKTRSKSLAPISSELWRFVLFSEFVFDLPRDLPSSLQMVPHAPNEAQPIIRDICDMLRSDLRAQPIYIERAEEIEHELSLPEHCKSIDDLGILDTFPFEERAFLQQAVLALQNADLDFVKNICASRSRSVWLGKGESQSQWSLIQAALALVEACEDYDRQLPEHARTIDNLLDFYSSSLREVDRLQREFEQNVSDILETSTIMAGVIQHARTKYARLVEKVQTTFIRHLETSGWPPQGRLPNSEVYDRFVSPRLSERGRKVVYILVDALRYELGVALQKLLADDAKVELHLACADFPTITLVGMASLLPGAAADLALVWHEDKELLVPKIANTPVANVSQRMTYMQKKLGDRFLEMRIGDFVRKKKLDIPDTVELLVLRSVEIDEHLENSPETTLKLIPETLNIIRAALHKVKTLGFYDAVIATDHGFFLNAQAEAGDVCKKPQGNWLFTTSRSMLGTGSTDTHNLVVSAEKVKIRGDFANFASPRSMAPYRSGLLYFHGGASIAEAVVPVITARLDKTAQPDLRKINVELSYKNGATRITTRLPVIDIEITMFGHSIFPMQDDFEILLEAHDAKGGIVGEAKLGGPVSPATGTITVTPSGESNKRLSVTLRMSMDFEGKFSVKALNPKTLSMYSKPLNLETDYTV